MDSDEIIRRRLANQHFAGSAFQDPAQIVSWMVAMQGQEWSMVRWAIGLRLPECGLARIEADFDAGRILRTHLLRPTWHLVVPADIHWLLELTKPRVHQANAYMYRKQGLDAAQLKRCHALLAKALAGGRHLTRAQLAEALERGKVSAQGFTLGYLLMHAELEGLIVSGPRVGRQFTYALMEDRVPRSRPLTREEALAELGRRYFASRGPATVHDLASWSGLTVAESRAAFAAASGEGGLVKESWGGKEYLFPTGGPASPVNRKSAAAPAGPRTAAAKAGPAAFLLPDYDEYGMSYKDRSAGSGPVVPPTSSGKRANSRMGEGGPANDHMVVVDGKVAGTWRRAVKGKTVHVDTDSFASLGKPVEKAVRTAVDRYLAFFLAGDEG